MVAFDPSSDYEIFDAVEAVTYRSVTSGSVADDGSITPTWSEVALAKALKRRVSFRSIEAAGGKVKMGDASWEISAEELGAVVPKEGDQIVASSVTWKVVAVDRKPALSMYRVFGRR